jgi:hypothetical protein
VALAAGGVVGAGADAVGAPRGTSGGLAAALEDKN